MEMILSMRDIYINSNLNPLTKFTSSSRSRTVRVTVWDPSRKVNDLNEVRVHQIYQFHQNR